MQFQWQQAFNAAGPWSDISAATGRSYTPAVTDLGKYLRCNITGKIGGAYRGAVIVAAANPIAPNSLKSATLSASPVSGTGVTIGQAFDKAGNSVVINTANMAFQWEISFNGGANWNNIPGATGSVYTPGATEIGKLLRAKLTGIGVYAGSSTVNSVIYAAATTPVAAPVYHFIMGQGSGWQIGSSASLQFRSDGPFERFIELKVDGKLVGNADYNAYNGSTVVDLYPSYLSTLAVGGHTVEFFYADGGNAETTFRILSAPPTPSPPPADGTGATENPQGTSWKTTARENTGDSGSAGMVLPLLLIGSGGVLASVTNRLRKRNNNRYRK